MKIIKKKNEQKKNVNIKK